MTTIGSTTTGSPPPREDRSTLATFAALTSVAAFLLAALGLVAVVAKGGSSSSAAASSEPVAVALSEFKITPSSISVPTGGKLKVTNTGSTAHNLSIAALGKKTADLAAGASETLDLSGAKEGTYEVICAIPGHADSGMKATLVIGGSGSAASSGSGDMAGMDHSGDKTAAQWADMDKTMQDGMAKGVETFVKGGATKGTGNQKLDYTVDPDGTKVFKLESEIIDWEVAPGKTVKAWAYNKQVPGPWIRTEPNDKVRVILTNKLPVSTDIHWHGVSTPFKMDGVAPITQEVVAPGQSFTYEWTNRSFPELGMYHAHNHGQDAVLNGLFAVFQVGDVPLPAAGKLGPLEIPAISRPTYEKAMVLNDAGVIGLSLNGKAYPATDAVVMNPGETLLMHYYNEGLLAHPMHLHHVYQLVVAKDGIPLAQPYWADTINVAPGERYSVLIMPKTEDIGVWAYHCHILNHAEGPNGLMGMVTALIVNDPNAKK